MVERVIRREARAKINLSLRVMGRRADGYHDIETLLTPVSLSDELTMRAGPELRLQLHGPGELIANVPDDARNLVVTAARELAEACGVEPLVDIELRKTIPAAAGLGGGSADAAAALWALDELWGCGLDARALGEVGLRVGSDVPALVMGLPVVARGRGEQVEPAEVSRSWWVLVPQPFPVATADAYRWWDEGGFMPGPGLMPLLEAAARGPTEAVAEHLHNDLEGPVSMKHGEITEAKDRLLEAGALGAVMCGSGPTVAGLVRTEEEATEVAEALSPALAVTGPP